MAEVYGMVFRSGLIGLLAMVFAAGCAAKTPVLPGESGATMAASGRQGAVAFAMYVGMDDYTGSDTEAGIRAAHARLAQVGSGAHAQFFLAGDSQREQDGFRTRISQGQGWRSGFTPLGELKTNHSPGLRDFLNWVGQEAGTRQVHLTLGSHGGAYRGIMYDYDGKPHAPGGSMTLQKASKALAKGYRGGRLPSVTFDACMMASIEVGEALKGTVSVMTGSEDFSMGGSIPWDAVARELAAGKIDGDEAYAGYMTEATIARGNWGEKGSRQWSAIALDRRFERAVTATDKLATALMRAMKTEPAAVRKAAADTRMFAIMAEYAEHYGDFYQRDMVEFCQALRQHVKDPIVTRAAAEVEAAVKAAVVAHARHPSEAMANGLAIYLPHRKSPKDKSPYSADYEKSLFARHTHWDEFLKALNAS